MSSRCSISSLRKVPWRSRLSTKNRLHPQSKRASKRKNRRSKSSFRYGRRIRMLLRRKTPQRIAISAATGSSTVVKLDSGDAASRLKAVFE